MSNSTNVQDIVLEEEIIDNDPPSNDQTLKHDLSDEDSSALLASLEALDTKDDAGLTSETIEDDDEWENTPLESDEENENVQQRERVGSSAIEQVLPIDKLKNGAANALELLSWGVDVVKHSASETAETIKHNETVQEVVSNLQPGLTKIKEDANAAGESLKTKSSELYEQAKPGLDGFTESASKSISSWTQSLSCFASSASQTLEKAIDDSAESLFGFPASSEPPISSDIREDATSSAPTPSQGSELQKESKPQEE